MKKVNLFYVYLGNPHGGVHFDNFAGLQIIIQNLSDMMSGKNKIPSEIYENLSDINFYVFKNSNKIQLLLRSISALESNLCYSLSVKVSTAFKINT